MFRLPKWLHDYDKTCCYQRYRKGRDQQCEQDSWKLHQAPLSHDTLEDSSRRTMCECRLEDSFTTVSNVPSRFNMPSSVQSLSSILTFRFASCQVTHRLVQRQPMDREHRKHSPARVPAARAGKHILRRLWPTRPRF